MVVVEVEELAQQEDSSRSVDAGRKAEACEDIEDEDEDDFGEYEAAAGMDRQAVGSVDRMGASTGAAAEVVAVSARRHAPWTAVCLEAEALG